MKRFFVSVAILAAVGMPVAMSSAAQGDKTAPPAPSSIPYTQPTSRPPDVTGVTVSRVVDLETLELSDGRRVKLIGVASPQSPAGAAAYAGGRQVEYYQFLRGLVEGKTANIEFDNQQFDPQGRLLGYVYLTDGTFVNAEVLRQGYGVAETMYGPNTRYQDYLERLAIDAKRNRWGLWK
jgi:micrococcal nuclease